MQAWADYLDALKAGAIPPTRIAKAVPKLSSHT